MVALNRMFVGYIRFQDTEFFIDAQNRLPDCSSQPGYGSKDGEIRKQRIINHVGPEYFPNELLNKVYIKPARVAILNQQKKSLQELEQREKQQKGTGEEAENGETAEGEMVEEEDDFGGDDYAHDYDADEDIDDNFDDGGADEDATF